MTTAARRFSCKMLTSEITSNVLPRDGNFTSNATSAMRSSSIFASHFTSAPQGFPTSVHTSNRSAARLSTSGLH